MGEQVAENRAYHVTIELKKDDRTGDYYFWVKPEKKWKVIQKNYDPIGTVFNFPLKRMSRDEGAKILLDNKIHDMEELRKYTEEMLEGLYKLKGKLDSGKITLTERGDKQYED
jgi:hypothetical protein